MIKLSTLPDDTMLVVNNELMSKETFMNSEYYLTKKYKVYLTGEITAEFEVQKWIEDIAEEYAFPNTWVFDVMSNLTKLDITLIEKIMNTASKENSMYMNLEDLEGIESEVNINK